MGGEIVNCPSCGNRIEDDQQFCPKCGTANPARAAADAAAGQSGTPTSDDASIEQYLLELFGSATPTETANEPPQVIEPAPFHEFTLDEGEPDQSQPAPMDVPVDIEESPEPLATAENEIPGDGSTPAPVATGEPAITDEVDEDDLSLITILTDEYEAEVPFGPLVVAASQVAQVQEAEPPAVPVNGQQVPPAADVVPEAEAAVAEPPLPDADLETAAEPAATEIEPLVVPEVPAEEPVGESAAVGPELAPEYESPVVEPAAEPAVLEAESAVEAPVSELEPVAEAPLAPAEEGSTEPVEVAQFGVSEVEAPGSFESPVAGDQSGDFAAVDTLPPVNVPPPLSPFAPDDTPPAIEPVEEVVTETSPPMPVEAPVAETVVPEAPPTEAAFPAEPVLQEAVAEEPVTEVPIAVEPVTQEPVAEVEPPPPADDLFALLSQIEIEEPVAPAPYYPEAVPDEVEAMPAPPGTRETDLFEPAVGAVEEHEAGAAAEMVEAVPAQQEAPPESVEVETLPSWRPDSESDTADVALPSWRPGEEADTSPFAWPSTQPEAPPAASSAWSGTYEAAAPSASGLAPAPYLDPNAPRPKPGTPEYEEMVRRALEEQQRKQGAPTPQPQTVAPPPPPPPQAPAQPQITTLFGGPGAAKPKPGTPEYEEMARQALNQRLQNTGPLPGQAPTTASPPPAPPSPPPTPAPYLDPNAPKPKPGTPEYEEMARRAMEELRRKREQGQ